MITTYPYWHAGIQPNVERVNALYTGSQVIGLLSPWAEGATPKRTDKPSKLIPLGMNFPEWVLNARFRTPPSAAAPAPVNRQLIGVDFNPNTDPVTGEYSPDSVKLSLRWKAADEQENWINVISDIVHESVIENWVGGVSYGHALPTLPKPCLPMVGSWPVYVAVNAAGKASIRDKNVCYAFTSLDYCPYGKAQQLMIHSRRAETGDKSIALKKEELHLMTIPVVQLMRIAVERGWSIIWNDHEFTASGEGGLEIPASAQEVSTNVPFRFEWSDAAMIKRACDELNQSLEEVAQKQKEEENEEQESEDAASRAASGTDQPPTNK